MHLKIYYYYDYLYHFFHIPCFEFDSLFPNNSCSSMVHHIVKKAVKEYNKKSSNSCYYYPACIIGIDRCDAGITPIGYTINVTLGLTTIKKSKIKHKWVKFPSYFEVDKTLRKDIEIKYKCPRRCYGGTRSAEELTFDYAYYDKFDGNKRLKRFPTIYHRDGAPV